MDIKGVGAIPCGRLYINGQGQATATVLSDLTTLHSVDC
nr:MAG TPA: hypothetical protein [Caudoviricetes sp.]